MSKSERKEKIIEYAMIVFGEKGYTATTLREIADKAQVTEMTLYRHFGSKENLFQEVIMRFSPASMLSEELDDHLTGDLKKDLTFLASSYLNIALPRVNMIRLGFIEAPNNPELARVVGQIPIRLKSHLTDYLNHLHQQKKIPQNNYEALAEMFYSVLFQYVLCKGSFPQEKPMQLAEELVSNLVSLFTTGIEKKER